MEQMFSKADVKQMIEAAFDFTFDMTEEGFNGQYVHDHDKKIGRVGGLKESCVEKVIEDFEKAQQVFG